MSERRAVVLVVDDDRSALARLVEMIRACGYDAVAAGNWSAALVEVRRQPPDLILLDVMMPNVDGFKLARMLKAEAVAFVPIILLTALEDLESKRRAVAAGADDFLTKPVSQPVLEIRLQSMLRIKQLTDELRAASERLAELAITDPLTGLANRRALDTHLERELARSRRYGNPLSALMIDVDHFKAVNDTHGHGAGDQVLALVARTLVGAVRQTDLVGRWGGEEFLVLAPETSEVAARILGERVRKAVATASAAAERLPAVTVSIGAASTRAEGEAAPALVERADRALYQAKDKGRDRVVLWLPGTGAA